MRKVKGRITTSRTSTFIDCQNIRQAITCEHQISERLYKLIATDKPFCLAEPGSSGPLTPSVTICVRVPYNVLFNAHHNEKIMRDFPCISSRPLDMPLTTVGKWTVLYSVVAVELAALAASWRLWDNLNRRPGRLTLFFYGCHK